jgi:Protein of unknown function (DUF3800)
LNAAKRPHYFIFSDESGTDSNNCKVVIVASVLALEGEQETLASVMMHRLIQSAVPPAVRELEGFVCHASDFQHDEQFLQDMMSIPSRCNMPIAFAAYYKDPAHASRNPQYTSEELQHMHTFDTCLAVVNDFLLKDPCGSVGTVYAEDKPEMRQPLTWVFERMRTRPFTFQSVQLDEDKKPTPVNVEMRVERLNPKLHFVPKRQFALSQVVDFVAYGLRRHLSGFKDGPSWIEAIFRGSNISLRPLEPGITQAVVAGPSKNPVLIYRW